MNLAVMQPYLFPYIGYFQLIYASDLFIIYDDVSYIKQGYINRNNILTPNGPVRFTVPVPGGSSNKLISELSYSEDVTKVLKTIQQSYSKSPYFDKVYPLLESILLYKNRDIAEICLKSYRDVLEYLGLQRKFFKSSELDYNRSLSAKDRLISFSHKFGADCYINTPGGRELYNKPDFAKEAIDLKFIDSLPIQYGQGVEEFVPNLSIIDVLMNCSPERIISILKQYELN